MKIFKLFCLTMALTIIIATPVNAEKIQGNVSMDWTNLTQNNREGLINSIREKIFKSANPKIEMEQFSGKKKDNKVQDNKACLKYKVFKTGNRTLAGFYLLNKILVLYGVKYNNDKLHVYYYDALGRLKYVDVLDKSFDEFPHIAYKYDKKGKLNSISYNLSEYDQYVYKKNRKFYGRWYNSRCYDKKAKVIMTRKLPNE